MEHTLVHELVHMYDQCTFKVDWNNLRHHACSEVRRITTTLARFSWRLTQYSNQRHTVLQIRANSLSGDCKWTRELRRGFFSFTKQHQVCTLPLGAPFNP